MKQIIKKIFLHILCISFNFVYAAAELQIWFVDVGEGDGIAILDPTGTLTVIDSGNVVSVKELIRSLPKPNINNLILTHAHSDHIGGVSEILKSVVVKKIFDNGENISDVSGHDPVLVEYLQQVRLSSRYKKLAAGDSIDLGEAQLEVLSPPEKFYSNDWNTNSLVMMIRYEKFNVLLMGDGNFTTEEYLIKKYGEKIKSVVLKAGHHGAADTGGEEFIRFVKPEIVVVSVDRDNIRGYPSNEALLRYSERGSKVLRIDHCGTIYVRGNINGQYKVKSGCK